MKSELRISSHTADSTGAQVVEVWFGGQMIATVYGADGPGVKVISKHEPAIEAPERDATELIPGITRVTFPGVR